MDILTFLNSLPPDLTKFFAFIATAAFAGPVASEVIQHVRRFKDASSQAQTIVTLVIYAVMGFASYALTQWVPASAVEAAKPFYAVFIGAVATFLTAQAWHSTQHEDPVKPAAAKPFSPPITGQAG